MCCFPVPLSLYFSQFKTIDEAAREIRINSNIPSWFSYGYTLHIYLALSTDKKNNDDVDQSTIYVYDY